MKNKTIIFAVMLMGFMTAVSAAENAPKVDDITKAAKTLDQLNQLVRENSRRQSKVDQQRITIFTRQKNRQQALLNQAKNELARERAREARLKLTISENDKKLAELAEQLTSKTGSLGEMIGEVRKVASDMSTKIKRSIVSAQYPERDRDFKKLAEATKLPQINEIRSLWLGIQNEMTEQSKIVKFPAEVTNKEGVTKTFDIVRVGAFNLISNEEYLYFDDESGDIKQLSRQPARYEGLVSPYVRAQSGYAPLALDPSSGAILSREVDRETWFERVTNYAGYVGVAIGVVLLIGLLFVIERTITLLALRGRINRQAKSSVPGNNPLGRIMAVYLANKDNDIDNLELKLDEAVLKETPLIEKRITIIKVFAAVAPLMGLLGTVIGMIETFQSITLYGVSDPKLMAGGISGALITTVCGIVAALPLILTHSFVAGISKNLIHILEQQSTGLIAQHEEAGA